MDALLLKPFSFSLGATCIKVYIDSSTEVGPSQVALAHCLASLVQKGSVNLTGSRVLQLECGSSGLAGLLAALAGAHTVLASSAITAQLRVNVEENLPIKRYFTMPSVQPPVSVGSVSVIGMTRKEVPTGFDVVLVCLDSKAHDASLFERLPRLLRKVAKPDSTILIASSAACEDTDAVLTACSKNFTVAALEVHAGDGDVAINLLTHKHSQRYFTECDSPVSPSSSSVSGGDMKDEPPASTPDHVARLTLPDADEVAKLLFTMHESSSDWSRGSAPASSPIAVAPITAPPAAASPASPAWLRAQLSLGACLYHKQQSAVPGQMRDGTTRAIVDIPLPAAWLKRLHTCLDSRTLSNLELRDRRKHALGLYTLEALSAAGVNVSFHPLDALHLPLSPQLFDLVRGKAGREPTLLMYLSHEDANLSLHLYRGNLPLSRDVRAVHRVPSGVIVLRVCLWDTYEAYSVPFEVKAKQHDGDVVGAVSMNNFTEIGTGSEPAARAGAPGPLKRRRKASPPHRFQDTLSLEQ